MDFAEFIFPWALETILECLELWGQMYCFWGRKVKTKRDETNKFDFEFRTNCIYNSFDRICGFEIDNKRRGWGIDNEFFKFSRSFRWQI